MCRRMVERWKGHLVLFTGVNIDLTSSNPDSACTCIFLGPAYRFENSCNVELMYVVHTQIDERCFYRQFCLHDPRYFGTK